MNNLEKRAKIFAKHWHCGQYRKYSNDTIPYYLHPGAVVQLLKRFVPEATPEMYCAAWCHDVLEDTDCTHVELRNTFGDTVYSYVLGLTDQFTATAYPQLNRAQRKDLERLRLARECVEVKTIKLADLIDNSSSITEHDPAFAKVYLAEKRRLLDESLREGNQTLWHMADLIVVRSL